MPSIVEHVYWYAKKGGGGVTAADFPHAGPVPSDMGDTDGAVPAAAAAAAAVFA